LRLRAVVSAIAIQSSTVRKGGSNIGGNSKSKLAIGVRLHFLSKSLTVSTAQCAECLNSSTRDEAHLV
jgi:hypothetical protein